MAFPPPGPEGNPSPQGYPPAGPHGYPPPGPYGYPPPSYPPPAMSPGDERLWAMLSQVGALLLGFLAPLFVMLVQGPKSPFVRRHSVESLNFQLTLLIATVAGVVFGIVTLGVGFLITGPLLVALGIAGIVFVIIASIRA